MNPALLSISELRNALAAGELSAGEITEHSLTLIERQNPAINAWTQICLLYTSPSPRDS